jgi:PadR family transcriptional regulator, regulatory protein AphA
MSPLTRAPLGLEQALLGFLRGGPLHGYELHRRLADPAGLGTVWQLKQARLYSLLARLEAEGYLTSRQQAQPARPARKLFRLTRAGKAAFLRWVQAPVASAHDLSVELLVKLYLAEREDPALAAQLIERQRAALRDWLAAQQAEAAAAPPGSYIARVAALRVGQTEAMLAWLEASALPLTGG